MLKNSCGILCDSTNSSYRLHLSVSVFTAELIAKDRTMLHISHHHNTSFIIYTGSISTIDAIKSSNKHPYVSAILDFCNKLTNHGYNILYCWVPGHIVFGNEKADEAAKLALNPLNPKVPFEDVNLIIKDFIHNNGQKSRNLKNNLI